MTCPELLQKVLTSEQCMERPDFLSNFMPKGLIVSPFETWKRDRRIFNHSFKIGTLKNFLEIFVKSAENVSEELNRHVDGGTFDIRKYMFKFSFQNICLSSMGVNSKDLATEDYHDIYDDMEL
jgi:cytochrome P450